MATYSVRIGPLLRKQIVSNGSPGVEPSLTLLLFDLFNGLLVKVFDRTSRSLVACLTSAFILADVYLIGCDTENSDIKSVTADRGLWYDLSTSAVCAFKVKKKARQY